VKITKIIVPSREPRSSFTQKASLVKQTVLLLSIYPYVNPQHGGQIRLANIARTYESAGWQVYSIAAYDARSYDCQSVGPHDVTFPLEGDWRQFHGQWIPYIDDLLTGVYAESDNGGFPLIMKKVPHQIDVIHVEQPWLWWLARKIQSARSQTEIVLIYGSQNIETILKRETFSSYGIYNEEVINTIEGLEKQAAQEADLTLTVTQSDADLLSLYGVKRMLVAPNGIEPWYAKDDVIERWRQVLPKSPWLFYVASAHPPNFTGFTKALGNSLAFIPPDSRLVIAGGVSQHIDRAMKETRWHHLNASRIQLLYILSENDLAAVKELAHVFLLPISQGGGSNIKTAEAIYSGSYVVGTRLAFRGYEHLVHLPEIAIADTPLEFRSAIQSALQRPPLSKVEKNADRQSLIWEKCLQAIPKHVELIRREKYGK
jgi:glycosyltransferase involved in cell wall biosynthesis